MEGPSIPYRNGTILAARGQCERRGRSASRPDAGRGAMPPSAVEVVDEYRIAGGGQACDAHARLAAGHAEETGGEDRFAMRQQSHHPIVHVRLPGRIHVTVRIKSGQIAVSAAVDATETAADIKPFGPCEH